MTKNFVNIANFQVLGRSLSEESKIAYLCTADTLWRAYSKVDLESSPEGFARWLLGRKPTLRGSSWRVYRRSAEYWLESIDAPVAAREVLRRDAVAPVTTALVKKGAPKRTSAKKIKRIPASDWQKLATYLRVFCKSEHAQLAHDWVYAGILTGCRPCEWRSSELRGFQLVVQTAKNTEWSGNGPTRTIDLSGLNNVDLAAVERMVDLAEVMVIHDTYDLQKRRVAAVVRNACARIWPAGDHHYSMYSGRHQGLANAKASLSPAEVSAVAGHVSTVTAQRSYGRRQSAWCAEIRPASPLPSVDEVATVRHVVRVTYEMEQKPS